MFSYQQTRIYHRVAPKTESGMISTVLALQQGDKLDPENDICFSVTRSPLSTGHERLFCLMAPGLHAADSSFSSAVADRSDRKMYFPEAHNGFNSIGIDGMLNLIGDIMAIRECADLSRVVVREVNARTGFFHKQVWLYWIDNAIRVLVNACNEWIREADKKDPSSVQIHADYPFMPDGCYFCNPNWGKLMSMEFPGDANIQRHLLVLVPNAMFYNDNEEVIFSGENIVLFHVDKHGKVMSVSPIILPDKTSAFARICESFEIATAKEKTAPAGLRVLAVSVEGATAAKYNLLAQAMYEVLETSTLYHATYYKLRNDNGEEVWLNAENVRPMAYA